MSKLHVPTVDREHAPTSSHDHVRTAARHSALGALCGPRAVSRRLGYLTALVILCGACVTTTGEPVVQRPPLDVPPAPPRIITPLPLPEPPPVEIPPEDTETVAKPPAPSKPRPPATNKPEAKPVEPPPVEPPPVPAPVPTAPPPTLSTPPQGDANALTRQIRDSIERTRRALEKIDYGTQSRERKKAYDDAKLFATQAEEAIKETNLVFAKELADKAERLAKELQSR